MSIAKTMIVPSVVSSRLMKRGVVERLVSALLSPWRARARGSPPENDHLRIDIGLPPADPRRDWWTYR